MSETKNTIKFNDLLKIKQVPAPYPDTWTPEQKRQFWAEAKWRCETRANMLSRETYNPGLKR